MAETTKRVTEDEVERAVRRLKSVLSVRVVVDDDGAIEEIHVLIDEHRNPKQVARDIESALVNDLGFRVDHRKISVAQVRTDALPGTEGSARVRLGRIALAVEGHQMQAEVAIYTEGQQCVGTVQHARGHCRQGELVARATLDAVGTLLRERGGVAARVELDLRSYTEADTPDGERVVAVQVSWMRNGTNDVLTGAAPVRDDAWRAAAAATLDALNRRLGLFSD